MSNEFFTISANSDLRGSPWMTGAYCQNEIAHCNVCRATTGLPSGRIELRPEPGQGSFWPDAIGSGGGVMGPFFSLAVKLALDETHLRYGSAVPAPIQPPYPKKAPQPPPPYFYLTGESGAKFDFETTGHRIKSICTSCGTIKKDPIAMATKAQFLPNTWNGSDLFYTDLSLSSLFCTQRVLELAAQRKWKGLRFMPLERAYDASFRGIDYLK
jgi:hypothetical protein